MNRRNECSPECDPNYVIGVDPGSPAGDRIVAIAVPDENAKRFGETAVQLMNKAPLPQRRPTTVVVGEETPLDEIERMRATPRNYSSLRVKRLRLDAVLPCRATPGSIGYDLKLPEGGETVHLTRNEPTLCKLGISVAIPVGYYGRIAPRSGLAVKYGVDVLAGVIDRDYRGEVGVVLVALGQSTSLAPGQAVAQLILERASTPPVVEAEDLDATTRGAGGFGSTDKT